jgi:CBS domain-containing protein
MRIVGDIMTRRVIVLTQEENLSKLEEGMARFGLRHLPVVEKGKLVGLVSHRDLLRASVSNLDPVRDERNLCLLGNTFVREIMKREVKTAQADTPLAVAARTMVEGKFGCLPVVDDEGTLVGIVTESDFLKLTAELLEAEAQAEAETAED